LEVSITIRLRSSADAPAAAENESSDGIFVTINYKWRYDDLACLAKDPQQRIAAIRAYRLQTGAGLKEAAAVIEKITAAAKAAGA
jgi:ribosomal protein L7/L12